MDMFLDPISRRSPPSQVNASRSTSPIANTQRSAATNAVPADILNAQSNSENVIEIDLVDSPHETTDRDAQGKSHYGSSNHQRKDEHIVREDAFLTEISPQNSSQNSSQNSHQNALPNPPPIADSVDFFT